MIRTFLVKALYQKLLGPEFGINEEVEHPYAKYQAGILSSSFTRHQGDPDHEDHIDGNLRTDAADRSESIEEGTDNDFAGGENNFTTPDTELDPRKGPRSIGISFVVRGKSPKIRACLTWARYRLHPGLARQEGVFQRIPNFFVTGWLDATQPLNGMELEDGIDGSSVSDPGIRLHIIPRPVPGATDMWTVNVFLENQTQYDTVQREEQRIFQPQIRILKDEGSNIEYFDSSNVARTDKDYADELAYYSRRTKARGYLCAAVWDEVDPGNESKEMFSLCWPDAGALPSEIAEEFASPSVRTEFIPLYTILQPELTDSMKFDADALSNEWNANKIRERLEPIVSRYKEWISSQRKNLESNFSNEDDLRRIGEENLNYCEESCDRIGAGIEFICEDERARAAFCLMNAVMSDNYRNRNGSPLQWREFQMAFILQCIRGVAGNEIKERDLCDVLWFPTGGGKTEAYLGITIFAIAYRRLVKTKLKNDGGVTVISRYTLRLLTIQQFQRALGVIVSADLRRVRNWMPKEITDGTLKLEDPELAKRFLAKRIWGGQRFSIGLWIGGSITPNDWAYTTAGRGRTILNAEGALLPVGHDARRMVMDDKGDPAQVQNCPVCSNTLCLPSKKKSRVQETKRLTWIVRSSRSINDLQTIPRVAFESETIGPVHIEGDPTFTRISDAPDNMTYYRLTMTIRSPSLTRDNVDRWWHAMVRPLLDPAGDSEPLESTRASMPGYFFVRMQPGRRPHDFAIYCTDGDCPLNQMEWYEETENNCVVPVPRPFENGNNKSRFVPISAFTIDEQVYARCPSFVLATSDKFAQLPFEPRCASLFGNVDTVHRNFGYGRRNCYEAPLLRNNNYQRIQVEADELNRVERFSPPSLIIQDELHLIEGPLGSMVGIYEMAVDVLATEGEQRPKYIASSATIKEADSQVGTIFRREIRTFPQPGIDASDNHFAKVEEDASCLKEKSGRLYMGLCPSKSVFEMPIKAQAIVMSEIYKIRQNPLEYGLTPEDAEEETDPYWTYVSYFSDLQLLSRFHSFYQDDILRDVKTHSPTRIANSADRVASFPREPGTRVFPITANTDIEIFNVSVFCNNRRGSVSVALYEDDNQVGRRIHQYPQKRCSNGENEFVSTEAVATLRSGEKIWVAVTNTDEHTSFQSVQMNEPWLEDTQNLGNPPEEFPDLFQGLTNKTDPAVRIQLLSLARPLEENKCIQLSSATPSSVLPQYLADMAREFEVDCVLTSPVFGTGIDVDRLALMKIMNQPKTNSGYIQSSGRVGRTKPGLVMTWLRSGRARDLSHYENFVGYHRTIHKHVEPITASPFSQESMRLCLGPIIVAILRNANNVSGTPVAPEWVTNLHGPQRMGTHGGDPEVAAVGGALARIADEQCIAEFRRMPHDKFVELFDQMQTVWHQLAQDLANNTQREFSYLERRPFRTPENNVVLGTPNHTDFQLDVAYENTPNSLRRTEPAASFSIANERDLDAIQIRPSQFITRYGPGSLLPGKSITLIAPPLEWMINDLQRIPNFMERNNANQAGLDKYEITDLQMRRILSRFNRDVDLAQLKMFGLPTNSSVGKADFDNVYNCDFFPEWGMCYGHTGQTILARIETIAGRGRVIRCPECQTQGLDFYSRRFTSVRILSACSRGHMSDLPWHDLVHQNIVCLGDVFEWREAGSGDDIDFVCRGHWDPRDGQRFIESSCGPRTTNYRALKAMSIRGQLECQGIFAETHSADPNGCPPDENGNSLAKITYKSSMSLRMPVVKTTLNIEPYRGKLYDSLSYLGQAIVVWLDGKDESWTKDEFVNFLERQSQRLRIGSPTIRLVRNAEEENLRRSVNEINDMAGDNVEDREITEVQALQEELDSLENYTRDRGGGVGIGNAGGTVADIRFPIPFDTTFGLGMEAMPFSNVKVTQIQTAYTREIYPTVDPNQQGGQEENVGRVGRHVSTPLRHIDRQDNRWYCGNQLLGEGIFLHLDPSKHTDQKDIFNSSESEDLEEWRSIHENFLGRVREERRRYDATPVDEQNQEDLQSLDAMELEAMSLNPIFVWWHSFAHEFINQLSVDSGFMTVSLGERVYCVRKDNGSYSAGLFIYACSPGTDGTLGGLTSLVDGNVLPRIVERTMERIRTCSSDPPCSARRINSSKRNGAACHVCLMNPETSCSYRNMFLDRNVVRQTM